MLKLFSFRNGWLILGIIGLISLATSNVLPEVDDKTEDDKWMHPKIETKAPEKGDKAQESELKGIKYEDESHWFHEGQDALRESLRHQNINAKAKNLILYVGDGMSVPTVTAARILKGQLEGGLGEEGCLYFEKFPNVAISKTFCSDAQVADSACSSTAIFTGSKTNRGILGLSPRVSRSNCEGQNDPHCQLKSILSMAQKAGKSTGIVTTTRVTHASPAAAYAHSADRNFEFDGPISDEGENPKTCDDIAEQLILNKPGKDINVVLGGGRRVFRKVWIKDEETGEPGLRTDGKDLIDDWIQMKKWEKAKFITQREELLHIDPKKTDYLLGLFSPSHLSYRDENDGSDPSLSEMVEVAIKILSKNPKGFFLFVEGGRIDHGHHSNKAQRALLETLEFDNSVRTGDSLTDEKCTLIVVTADHSNVMTINGYPGRGNPILGLAGTDINDLPYTTLSYANGPGYRTHVFNNTLFQCSRVDITKDPFEDIKYRQEAMVPLKSETHGGDDVVIYAKGPFAHLYSGVKDQSYIPHAMSYAACIGNGETSCG